MASRELRLIARWAFWLATLGVATLGLLWARGEIDQSHVALTLLLIVLGGSASGGRALGFTLAICGFVIIDYFFQPPYDLLSVGKPLDWVVLVAFFAVAFVATELVTRARGEAATARRRSDEMASLSRLGSETLRYARPEEALAAIANLIQSTLDLASTSIRLWKPAEGLAEQPVAASGQPETASERLIGEIVARSDVEHLGHAVVMTIDGSAVVEPVDVVNHERPIVSLALPLLVEQRRVGVLVIRGRPPALRLDAAGHRFLSAIAYYAALGAERQRLAAEAEHATALREESRAKDEVLATVSHDLRTPLTTIKLLAQGAAKRGEPSAVAIEEETDRLARMVTNVLDLSRIRAGAVVLDIEINTAEDLVGAAISRATGLLRGRHINPRLDLSDPPLAGRFDFVQALRILGNLLDNAIRHTPPGGAVDIETAREGQWMVIHVSDRGPGVPAHEAERIFEPFYRPRADRDGGGGHAGLGLSIARRLASIQQGTVDYEPRAGGGTTFTIRLPVADWTDEPLNLGVAASEAERGSTRARSGAD